MATSPGQAFTERMMSKAPSSQLSESTAAGAASAVASSASTPDQLTVKPQQQPEPTGCEPVNYKASNEPAASTKDTTGKSTELHRGTATSPPAARPPKRMQTVPKYRYWEAAAGQFAGQDSNKDEIAQLATFTDTLLVCCLCGGLLKDTVQLTCLHNCCQCCFSAAASACNSGYVACCLCGDLTILGAQQPNGFIERELQRYMAIADSRSCGACKDNGEPDTPATVWCSACKHSLCGDCLALHKRYKRSHVTQSLDELKSLDEVCLQSPSSSCPIHKRPLEIACLNCKRAKCTSCWIECKKNMHEMHISGDDSFENYVDQFIAYISSEESVLLQTTQVLDSPKTLLIDLKAARALHLEQISRRKRRIADAVDVAYQKVECLTKDAYDDLEKEAGDASKVAERIGLNLSDARKYIRRLFDANNKHEILNQHEIIRERQKVLSADIRDLKTTTDAIGAVDIESSLPDDLETVFEAWIGVLHTDSDRWSPINPEDKKLYDRKFLLSLQFAKQSLVRPEGLPQLSDIILDKGPRGSSSKNDRDRGGRGGRSPPRDVRLPRKVVESNREEVQLHRSGCAYKPRHMKSEVKLTKSEELSRRFKNILNKLTPQNFESLISSALALPIDTGEDLHSVVNLTFEQAVSEPGYSVSYANMFRSISSITVATDKPGEVMVFRKLLLARCQRQFEKDLTDKEDSKAKLEALQKAENEEIKKRLQEEYDMFVFKSRRRSLGNIRFIGELFKQKFLTEATMHDCIVKLLKNNEEDSLECLCGLLKTIGKEIDREGAKPRNDQYFNHMKKITTQKKVSSRVRFKLQDIIDLRENNWVPRFADNNPKTIAQIH